MVEGLAISVVKVSYIAFKKGWHSVNYLSHSIPTELGPAAFPGDIELIVEAIRLLSKSIVWINSAL